MLASKALTKLISLGVRVRDRLVTNHPPEPTIRREIDNYIKWSHTDGDLLRRNFIPALIVETKSPRESVSSVVQRMTTKLQNLGYRYRDLYNHHRSKPTTVGLGKSFPKEKARTKLTTAPRLVSPNPNPSPKSRRDDSDDDLPTLYGIIIAETIVTFITYNTNIPTKEIRPLQIFNFADSSQDVWNGLAVGILVVWVRNFLMAQGAEVLPEKEREESDPDV